jgi:hypothetical protein
LVAERASGSVAAVVPAMYAFVEGFRLRFPVAVFNAVQSRY